MRTDLQTGLERAAAMYPETSAQLPALKHFWLSPEGEGTFLLFRAAASILWILLFAWLGGRFAARYPLRRRPTP